MAMKAMMKQLIYEGVVSETEWPRLRNKWLKDPKDIFLHMLARGSSIFEFSISKLCGQFLLQEDGCYPPTKYTETQDLNDFLPSGYIQSALISLCV